MCGNEEWLKSFQFLSADTPQQSQRLPSTLQQQIPLEGSSHQLSWVFVAEGQDQDDQDLWKWLFLSANTMSERERPVKIRHTERD